METAKKGRPFGFYVCALGFTFERFAFYTMKYLLAIWIATSATSGGLGLSDIEGSAVSGSFVAWTYITPIIGGYIADHWISPRICVALGMLLMGIGYIILYFASSLAMVNVMIAFVAVGTGLFKGNLSGINGLLFHDQEELDQAFSIQYSFVNIGSFCGTTFLAPLGGNSLTFQMVFLICGLFLVFDACWFVFVGGKVLGDAGKAPFKKDAREYISEEKREASQNAPLTSLEKKKVFAIVLLTLLSAVFWMLWYMAYMPAYYTFGWGDGDSYQNLADWTIGGFEIPTSWFDSVNALVCIILGPVLGMVWSNLDKKGKDWSMFTKTALGCMLVGIAYFVMVIAYNIAGGQKEGCSVFWLVLVCLLMSVGEMIFSPLGNSFINKFSPAKLLGFLLGFWPIAVYLAQMVYPKLYAYLTTVDFSMGYGICGAIVVVFGLILIGFSKKLDAWSNEE